jgi:hypothetical protein
MSEQSELRPNTEERVAATLLLALAADRLIGF